VTLARQETFRGRKRGKFQIRKVAEAVFSADPDAAFLTSYKLVTESLAKPSVFRKKVKLPFWKRPSPVPRVPIQTTPCRSTSNCSNLVVRFRNVCSIEKLAIVTARAVFGAEPEASLDIFGNREDDRLLQSLV